MKNIFFNMGFIILCPEPNLHNLKITEKSVRVNYKTSCVAILPKNATKEDVKAYKEVCPTFKGKDTITSMINAGFSKGHPEWNSLVMEGCWIKPNMDKKYSIFHDKNEKNIFYPVHTEYDFQLRPKRILNNFWDCSLNGITIHRKTFLEVGFLTDDEMELSRLSWAFSAAELGCNFKAIHGAKFF